MVTKKQHYVPQLLLRRFATPHGSESRINVYDFERQQYRKNQNIRDVCSSNYTYDTNNSFERFLSEHVESPAGSALEILAQTQDRTDPRPSAALLRFLLVQLARTRQMYESSLNFTNAWMQTIFAEVARLNGLDEATARELHIQPSEPREVLAYLAAYAATQYRLISDLNLALVLNQTRVEFILSDHPVFQHNWYLRESAHPMAGSITVRGVQFFLPLSPSVTCCLYDPSVYLYGQATEGAVINATEGDVGLLNSFQAINAGSLLLARSATMEAVLSSLGSRYADSTSFFESATYVPASVREDGTLRSTHLTQRKQTRLPAMPAFVKIKNKVRSQTIECVHRCPENVAAHKMFDESLRRQRNAP
ncbi:hypothetical protein C7S18_00015 [Ahniella affigens]|uniref:DUF4238 domain-containing protein n=1 Tax=Ahniella affigens TaxID=2021234 RepID=A0A2P1PLI2_9GAMM|nr:hypothetical protein C7S18_00015 [Ahniella affigens]